MRRHSGLAALVIVLAPAVAVAQVQTYYHAGAWDAFSGRNDRGGAVCGIGNTNPADGRRLTLEFDIGGTATTFSAAKPDWAIPDNQRAAVVMQVGLNTPWIEQGTGHEHAIDWALDPVAMASFWEQFRVSSSMTVTFPDGNEPPWAVSLAGSSAISATFQRCIRDLTEQVDASQQPAQQAAPEPPPAATQPFSPAAAPPPVR